MKHKILSIIFRYSQVVMLVLIVAFLSVTTPTFLQLKNISNIVMQQIPFLLIISMGMTTAVLAKGIDLSISSNLALSSCIAAYFIKDGHDVLGVLAGLGVGTLIGAINGLLITKIRMIPFIATYTMDMVVRGTAYLFMGGLLYYGFSDNFRSIATGEVFGVSNLLIIACSIFAIYLFVLKKTTFGRNIYSIGLNREATELSGVNTGKILMVIYTVNGLLAGITGLLFIAQLNAAEATLGDGYNLKMMAATLIGGTVFTGGKGGVGRTLVGVAIMMVLTNGMNLNGIPSLWQDAVFGFAIIISVVINRFGEIYFEKTAV